MVSTCFGYFTAASGKSAVLRVFRTPTCFKNADASPGVSLRIESRTDVAFVINS